MPDSRTLTALVGLAVSVVVSVAIWLHFDTLLVFLFLPFVPLLFRGLSGGGVADERSVEKECPVCGFTTQSSEVSYCPRDGTELPKG